MKLKDKNDYNEYVECELLQLAQKKIQLLHTYNAAITLYQEKG